MKLSAGPLRSFKQRFGSRLSMIDLRMELRPVNGDRRRVPSGRFGPEFSRYGIHYLRETPLLGLLLGLLGMASKVCTLLISVPGLAKYDC